MDEAKQEAEQKNVVTIAEAGPCKKKVTIEIPEEAVHAAIDEQYSTLRKDAIVPGFRKGRAPLRLLEKRFGKDVSQQVKLKLLSDASESAIKDSELDTIGEPDIDHESIEIPEKGAMKFDFEVDVRPEFKLPELENIPVEKSSAKITDSQIDDELEGICKRFGIWAPVEKTPAKEGDQIIADVLLKTEGSQEEQKHDNLELFVRKNGFVGAVPVGNLDELLTGTKHGDVKETTVEVPKTFYNEEYRGKKFDIKITVKDVKQLKPAEINEELFGKVGVKDEKELRNRIREMAENRSEQQSRMAMTDQIYEYLLDKTSLDLPEDVVADQSKQLLQRQYTDLMTRGLDREQIEEHMDQLRASSATQAERQLKLYFLMDKVAEKLEVEVSEEELNGHIAMVAAQRGSRPERMREEMLRDGSLAQFSLQIREQKCIEKLLESAKIKEVKALAEKKTKAKTTKKTAKKASASTKAKEGSKAKETGKKQKIVRKKKTES